MANAPVTAPRFSVVTPSFRSKKWLPLCIKSVSDQQNVLVEHIIQDACSDDGTEELLKGYPEVCVFREPDRGMYDALNRGFDRATGDILCHLNCDEQYLPNALERVAAHFERLPDVDVIFGNVIVVDPKGDFICFRKVVKPQRLHTMVAHLPTFTCATFFRRSVWQKLGVRFDTNFRDVADARWVLRLLGEQVKCAVMSNYTSVFTETGDNRNLAQNARDEITALRGEAPLYARAGRPIIVMLHRIRKLMSGSYRESRLSYDVFTSQHVEERVHFEVSNPGFWWPSRFKAAS